MTARGVLARFTALARGSAAVVWRSCLALPPEPLEMTRF
jgi:hypothetical protein